MHRWGIVLAFFVSGLLWGIMIAFVRLGLRSL